MDNFNIMGSDNMTPIVEKENQFGNPYATTLWKNKDENKNLVNRFKTDSRDNIKRTLSTRRNINMKPLHLSNKITKESINSASKKKKISSYLLDVDESETSDLPSVSSNNSDSFQPFGDLTNDTVFIKKKKIWNSAIYNKVDSPLSLTFLKTPITQKEIPFNSKAKKDKFDFLNVLEVFTLYESNYLDNLKILKDCFHHQFSKNDHIRSKITTINDMNDGELLIFGNIGTMIELNINFLDEMKSFVSSYFNINKNDNHFWSIAKDNLNTKDLNQFNVAQVLRNAFNKWKQTYKTYIITQQKQIKYIKFLLDNRETRYYMLKWLDLSVSKVSSFKKGSQPPDEYLFRLLMQPKERLQNWQNFLESLVMMSKNVLSTKNYDLILRLYEELNDYAQDIQKQAESFNTTRRLSATDCLDSTKSFNTAANSAKHNSMEKLFSETSSVYTGRSVESNSAELKNKISLTSLKTNNAVGKSLMNEKTLEKLLENESTKMSSFDVDKNEAILKTIKIELHELNDKLEQMSFTGYTNYLKKFVSAWGKLFAAENEVMDYNIYEMYLQKLEVQSIHLAELENYQLKNLEKSLKSVINYVDFAYKKIKDLSKLLNTQSNCGDNNIGLHGLKSKVHNVDKSVEQEAIRRHIKYLSQQLKQEIPHLLQIIGTFKIEFIKQYNQISLEFLKIMVGNKSNLEAYVEQHKSHEVDFGDNFDIIQQFINNRDKNEEIIKENNKKLYYNSKTFRYLFK